MIDFIGKNAVFLLSACVLVEVALLLVYPTPRGVLMTLVCFLNLAAVVYIQ